MEHVDIDDVEPSVPGGRDVDCRGLTAPLDTDGLALNYYRLSPGDSFSGGLHTHLDQEEVFVVVEGTATFETPDEEFAVGPNEAVRFAPGEYQTGRNEGDDDVVAFALGAPRDSTEIRIPLECRECGHDALAALPGDDGMQYECPECGTPADLG
ncbi:cupin domain-containing protein [Halobaculum sp. P14]|uniref:cupin domain-containing protein n=1 Tax=Halobaculum sp. P14 TaxID=3421638 RepID=UPI003EB96202